MNRTADTGAGSTSSARPQPTSTGTSGKQPAGPVADPDRRSARSLRAQQALLDSVRAIINRHELQSSAALPGVIAVTGADRKADGTAVAHAFARILADELGSQTCLVDFTWLARAAPVDHAVGADPGGGPEFVRSADCARLTELRFSDAPRQRHNAIVHDPEFATLLGKLRNDFEHVVYDVPTPLSNSGSLVVMSHADASILVVRHRATPLALVEQILTTIEPTPNLAVVVNHFRPSIPSPVRRLFGG